MEHRILLGGGECWLPFARSRIAALRALSSQFVAQKFIMPDGANVVVSIEPNHEYIRIDGGSTGLMMDSGVVDVIAVGLHATGKYAPGILHWTDSVKGLAGSYALPTPPLAGKWESYLTYPKGPTESQLVGSVDVSATRLIGRVLPDKSSARSFSPNTDPANTSPTDDLLYLKKVSCTTCPASIFTGRCRLYVQAMYGLPTYEYFPDGGYKQSNAPFKVFADYGTPALDVTPFVETGDNSLYAEVRVSTHSGVYLDSKGFDWLMQIENDKVMAYPLRAPKEVEALRVYLRGKKIAGKILSNEAKRKLETFILARSLPDVKNKQLAGTVPTTTGIGLGYGWHWSLSGAAAVYTTHKVVLKTPGDPYSAVVQSSTFSLVTSDVALDSDPAHVLQRRIIVTSKIEESDKEWGIIRSSFCILYPDMHTGLSEKLTSHEMGYTAGSAIVYSYFVGEVLKSCTITVTFVPAYSYREMTDQYMESDVPGTSGLRPHLSFGLNEGYYKDHTVADYWDVTMNVSTGSLTERAGFTDTVVYDGVTGKQIVGWALVVDSYPTPGSGYVSGPFPTPVPVGTGALSSTRNEIIATVIISVLPGTNVTRKLSRISAIKTDKTTVISEGYKIIFALASYDAECVYTYSRVTHSESVTGVSYSGVTNCDWEDWWEPGIGITPHWYDLFWGFESDTEVFLPPPVSPADTVTEDARILGRASSTAYFPAAVIDNIFYPSIPDEVSESFFALSGVQETDPLVITSWAPAAVQMVPWAIGIIKGDIELPTVPVVVGWV